MRIEQIARRYDLRIKWRMFPLHPDTPQEGRSLEDLFKGSTVDVGKMLDHLEATARQLGLAFGTRTMTYNSRLAQELGLWAESVDPVKADQFHMAMFKAYFKHGLNIAETDNLLEVVAQCSLPVNLAEKIVYERSFSEAVDHDWNLARKNRITAVPTLVINSFSLAGFQPFKQIQFLLNKAGIAEKK